MQYETLHHYNTAPLHFSFRAQFSAEEDTINPIHGSDNPEHARQELEYFFPMQKTVAVIKPDAYENKGIHLKHILCTSSC